MSRTEALAEDSLVDAWRGLLGSHARAHNALERALKDHDLGVSEYEVLERLATESDGEQRRMQELGEAVHLSQSALSRAVARLERDGLVKRSMCADDRRGVFVCLTAKGKQLYEQALPTHRAVLKETWASE